MTARGGKWEVHTNPHDVRQIWVRLPGLGLTEIPWIHREHAHQPFNDRTWQYLKTITTRHADLDRYEAGLAEALDQLMRRARAGSANSTEQYLITRSTPARTPPPLTGPGPEDEQLGALAAGSSEDSLDDLDQDPEDTVEDEVLESPGASVVGYGLYDAGAEALKW